MSAPVTSRRQRLAAAIPFVGCTLIWSSTWLVIREGLETAPAAWSVTYRFGVAALAMLAYAAATRARLRFTRSEHGFAALYGISQYCLNYLAVYLAERSVTSGLVAVLFASLVVPNALFGWLFLKQDVSRPFLLGSGVAMAGMALLFAHELHVAPPTGQAALAVGIGWTLAGILFSSLSNVAQGTSRARALPVASLVAWGMVWGTAADAAVALTVDGPPPLPLSAAYWAGVFYLGLIGSALAFTFYFQLIRVIGPARGAYTSVLSPPIAMLLSTLFEGYRWSASAAAGALLTLGGLVVALRAKQSASPSR